MSERGGRDSSQNACLVFRNAQGDFGYSDVVKLFIVEREWAGETARVSAKTCVDRACHSHITVYPFYSSGIIGVEDAQRHLHVDEVEPNLRNRGRIRTLYALEVAKYVQMLSFSSI